MSTEGTVGAGGRDVEAVAAFDQGPRVSRRKLTATALRMARSSAPAPASASAIDGDDAAPLDGRLTSTSDDVETRVPRGLVGEGADAGRASGSTPAASQLREQDGGGVGDGGGHGAVRGRDGKRPFGGTGVERRGAGIGPGRCADGGGACSAGESSGHADAPRMACKIRPGGPRNQSSAPPSRRREARAWPRIALHAFLSDADGDLLTPRRSRRGALGERALSPRQLAQSPAPVGVPCRGTRSPRAEARRVSTLGRRAARLDGVSAARTRLSDTPWQGPARPCRAPVRGPSRERPLSCAARGSPCAGARRRRGTPRR